MKKIIIVIGLILSLSVMGQSKKEVLKLHNEVSSIHNSFMTKMFEMNQSMVSNDPKMMEKYNALIESYNEAVADLKEFKQENWNKELLTELLNIYGSYREVLNITKESILYLTEVKEHNSKALLDNLLRLENLNEKVFSFNSRFRTIQLEYSDQYDLNLKENVSNSSAEDLNRRVVCFNEYYKANLKVGVALERFFDEFSKENIDLAKLNEALAECKKVVPEQLQKLQDIEMYEDASTVKTLFEGYFKRILSYLVAFATPMARFSELDSKELSTQEEVDEYNALIDKVNGGIEKYNAYLMELNQQFETVRMNYIAPQN